MMSRRSGQRTSLTVLVDGSENLMSVVGGDDYESDEPGFLTVSREAYELERLAASV